MPRPRSPEVRRALIERAAAMLASRQPVTADALARACGVSTTALYTYFAGMPGLWSAVRQEGFLRLARRLEDVEPPEDPVHHLAALGVAYLQSATADPDLYRLMFDATVDLVDAEQAAATFAPLVEAVARAQDAGTIAPGDDPADIATRYWAYGHGLASLAVSGMLEPAEVARHAQRGTVAILVDAGAPASHATEVVGAAWQAGGTD